MTLALDLLPEPAKDALRRAQAKATSYAVRVYTVPGETARLLVMLGEAHVKLAAASELGEEVVKQFPLRGVETFPVRRVVAGRALWAVIHVPRLALRALSLGLVKGSTIVDAKRLPTGHTVEIERPERVPLSLHVASLYITVFFGAFWLQLLLSLAGITVPWLTTLLLVFELHFLAIVPAILLRRHPWSWMLHPAVAILTVRDTIMADGTVRMLAEHPDARTAVVVLGRAHLPGTERELVEKHGFRRIPF
jgi:hypothetical protein